MAKWVNVFLILVLLVKTNSKTVFSNRNIFDNKNNNNNDHDNNYISIYKTLVYIHPFKRIKLLIEC